MNGQRLWREVLETARSKPAPFSAFDAFFHLALIVTMRGTKTVVDYYTELIAEMRQRAEDKIGSIPNEKYRLLWDNLPIWYKTKWLSDKFASHGACLVADTYTSAWCKQLDYMDKTDFVKSMADCYTMIYLNIGVDQMVDTVKGMVKKYDVDGIVMHSNRSCKPYSPGPIRHTAHDTKGDRCPEPYD